MLVFRLFAKGGRRNKGQISKHAAFAWINVAMVILISCSSESNSVGNRKFGVKNAVQNDAQSSGNPPTENFSPILTNESVTSGPSTDTTAGPVVVAEIVVPDLSLALVSRSGSKVRGVLNLWKESGGKVCIQGKFSGFAPTTKHGFHIHAVGDCSTSDASSAAGHFNPENKDHGNHTSPTRHLGDLGNLTADTEGIATINQVYEGISFLNLASIWEKMFKV